MEGFEPLYKRIEDAIDAHPTLERAEHTEPRFIIDRAGVKADIIVKMAGLRNGRYVSGDGATPEEAAQDLIESLDYWTESFK